MCVCLLCSIVRSNSSKRVCALFLLRRTVFLRSTAFQSLYKAGTWYRYNFDTKIIPVFYISVYSETSLVALNGTALMHGKNRSSCSERDNHLVNCLCRRSPFVFAQSIAEMQRTRFSCDDRGCNDRGSSVNPCSRGTERTRVCVCMCVHMCIVHTWAKKRHRVCLRALVFFLLTTFCEKRAPRVALCFLRHHRRRSATNDFLGFPSNDHERPSFHFEGGGGMLANQLLLYYR